MAQLTPRHRALGQAVRTLRQDRGLSQEALADLAGMSGNYVGDTERGERNISVRALWQIADALGVSASVLFREAEKRGATKHASRSG
jgi:transcriptional regulator with XRE-family HTH domain